MVVEATNIHNDRWMDIQMTVPIVSLNIGVNVWSTHCREHFNTTKWNKYRVWVNVDDGLHVILIFQMFPWNLIHRVYHTYTWNKQQRKIEFWRCTKYENEPTARTVNKRRRNTARCGYFDSHNMRRQIVINRNRLVSCKRKKAMAWMPYAFLFRNNDVDTFFYNCNKSLHIFQ